MAKKQTDEEPVTPPDEHRDVLGNIVDVANDPDAERKLAEAAAAAEGEQS